MTKYFDKLPREVKGIVRCQCIKNKGNRCGKVATVELRLYTEYFTTDGLYLTVSICTHCYRKRTDFKDKNLVKILGLTDDDLGR